MRLTTERIAYASARRPWRVVSAWVLAVVIAVGLSATLLGDTLTTNFAFTYQPESMQVEALLSDRMGRQTTTTEVVVVRSDGTTVDAPAYRDYVLALQNQLNDIGDPVLLVGSYLTFTGPISEDRRTVLLPVVVAGEDFAVMSRISAEIRRIIEVTPAPAGFLSLVGGPGTLNDDIFRLAEEGLHRGEAIGIGIALVILTVVFGAIVAAMVPIALAAAAIAVALGITAIIGQLLELSFLITSMITMLGLAVGIDYSLFVVSRYREERLRGNDKVDAIARAGATANRAVFFSGLIVVLALAGMLFVPTTIFQSLGLGAMTIVIVAVLAALTLLPAMISLLGDDLERLRVRRQDPDPDQRGGRWDRLGGWVMARPWLSLITSVGLLLFLAIQYLSIETGFAGVSTLPQETRSRKAFELISDSFPAGFVFPVEIVIDGQITPQIEAAIGEVEAALAEDDAFADASVTINSARDLALISAPMTYDFQSVESADAIDRLRHDILPAIFEGTDARALVGGDTAFNVDFVDDADEAQPIVVAWVLGLSFLLLLLVFRSIVIPTTSILMNLLSVGAAYGLIVLVFQEGVGFDIFKSFGALLGFQTVEAVESWLPLMLFTILFGLSMDYHIFLLSRIKEHVDRTGDTDASVRHGLRTTGAIITGAALIMVAVFGGFAAGELVPLQQMGFGLAAAILIDATIIRSVTVPATMKLLGRWNWYLPSWLDWLPTVRFEEARGAGPSPTSATSHDVEPGGPGVA